MIWSLAVVSSFLSGAAALSSPLWPQPTSASLGSATLHVAPSFKFTSPQPSSFLDQAFDRYVSLINSADTKKPDPEITSCSVEVAQLHEDEISTLQYGVDESYQLSLDASGACSIKAGTVWGALHGMETFSQLLERSEEGCVETKFAPAAVSDKPRFTHRGMLIDSSRHYLPMTEIKRMIDTLPMNKFNVLHWHLVDAQSFPFDSPSAPEIVKGAYTPKLIYSIDDVKELNTYAANRGVRLFIEIDVPGHAGSWQYGYPQLMADCLNKYTNVNNYALNPTLDETYTVIEKILTDIIATTGIKYFHLGGDEVVYGCWSNDASITSYMSKNGMTNYDQLLSMFVQRVDAIVRKLGATPVHWEEVFTAGAKVEPDTVFEVWTAQSKMAVLADANYTIISAPSDVWYLDSSANTWSKMYEYDPVSALTTAQKPLVLGGEVAMWGEHVDEHNIESIVYPRASSVGERLWSDASINNSTLAKDRFLHQQCRLISRGFNPSSIEPGYCAKNPV